MPPKTRGAVRKPRRKDKKNIALGQAHIKTKSEGSIFRWDFIYGVSTGNVASFCAGSAGPVGLRRRWVGFYMGGHTFCEIRPNFCV